MYDLYKLYKSLKLVYLPNLGNQNSIQGLLVFEIDLLDLVWNNLLGLVTMVDSGI